MNRNFTLLDLDSASPVSRCHFVDKESGTLRIVAKKLGS
jgi:hypothetical protein